MSGLAYRHQRVQRLRRLVGRRSARKDEGRFVIEGVNLLEEALDAQVPIEAVYLDSEWALGPGAPAGENIGGAAPKLVAVREPGGPDRLSRLLDRCLEGGARVFELAPGVLARVADTVTPQPVMAIVETPNFELSDLGALAPQLTVVCVDVRDPGNAGTVVRSAWAAGADGVVFCEGAVDPWNPKAVRSSAGAVLHIPIVNAARRPGPSRRSVSGGYAGWGRSGRVEWTTPPSTSPCPAPWCSVTRRPVCRSTSSTKR